MLDYRTKLIRSFVSSLDALALSIHEQTDAIRANTEAANNSTRQRTEQPPLPSPIPVELTKGIAATIQGETKTQVRTSWDWRDYLRLVAEIAGLFVLIFYACTTHKLWMDSQTQTAIAEQQSRPWLKVTDVVLKDPETLSFNQHMMAIAPGETLQMFAPAKEPIARANIRAEFQLRNIGKSVAQNIWIVTELFFVPRQSAADAVDQEQKRFCTQAGIANYGAQYSRSAVFPEDPFTMLIGAVGWISKDDVTDRDGSEWVDAVLIGCVTYQQPRNFQTRIAYNVAGAESRQIKLGVSLNGGQIRFLRDEHHEYAQ